MVGHCAPACHCPSPAAAFMPPVAVYHSRSTSNKARSSTAPLLEPRPRPAVVDDESHRKLRYFGVSGYMFTAAVIVAPSFWPDWQDSLTTAIVFSYTTAMILLLLKHWDNKEDQPARPRRCHEITWVQMFVVTGIMLISVVLMVSIFPAKWGHLAMIVFISLAAATFSFLLLNVWDAQHERERVQAASAGSEETSMDLA
ncbi:uncharacterized protein LOC119347148 isoform X1 [Triticum dicoccoides]|uniref:uncharacterized protein LOC119347148 isoform X1 n=1 Tax=Triticum dicoccoides TaxID=85692 RepID=UPI00189086C9|nr:uncharacterized protein LOC119347148 isoform X1 [Triticum dicoccoides]